MKQDGRDLLGAVPGPRPAPPTDLAPAMEPVRIVLAVLVVVVVLFGVQASAGLFMPANDLGVDGTPSCGTGSLHDPERTVGALRPAGAVHRVAPRRVGGRRSADRRDERARFWLNSDVAGDRAVEVTMLPRSKCSVRGATEVPSDEVGTRRYERVERAAGRACRSTRDYVFEGGCVSYGFELDGARPGALLADADGASRVRASPQARGRGQALR